MDRLKAYILSNFTRSLITLFIPFFTIMSLIYIINISKLSAKMVLEFQDFFTLYLYVLPDIIFATLPLAFLGAIINSLSHLSESNEVIAIFSIGYRPKKILSYFLPISLIFTVIIVIISIFITPYATQKMYNYRNKKIYESNLKILPKKLSQTFGKHHIFIDENKNGKFKNVTMFTERQDGHMQILLSKDGFMKNEVNSSSYLNLHNGMLYRYRNNGFSIVDFENMKLYNTSKYVSSKILSTKDYWLEHRAKFYYYLLISLSPLLLILLYISLGVYNPRYQRNLSSLYMIGSILLIYLLAIVTRKTDSFYVLIAVFLLWIFISILFFNKRVLKRY